MTRTPHSVVQVASVAYLGTPDLVGKVDPHAKTLNLVLVDGGGRRARLIADHHSVLIEKAPAQTARTFVGFQVIDNLGRTEKALRDHDYEVQRRTDFRAATPGVLVVTESFTTVPIHLYRVSTHHAAYGTSSSEPPRSHGPRDVPDELSFDVALLRTAISPTTLSLTPTTSSSSPRPT